MATKKPSKDNLSFQLTGTISAGCRYALIKWTVGSTKRRQLESCHRTKKAARDALKAIGDARKRKVGKRPHPPKGLDFVAVRELELFTENDGGLYRQRLAIEKNQLKHWKAGKWSWAGATKGFLHFVDAGARKYLREFSSRGTRMQDVFPKPVRIEVARRFASEFKTEQATNGGSKKSYGIFDMNTGKKVK